MDTCIKCILLLHLVFRISPIFCGGPIIELKPNYNRITPWNELKGLGLEHLEETECLRECVKGALPRVCLFTFVLEHYAAMGTACRNCSEGVLKDCFSPQCIIGDRSERGVMSINRQIPSPALHVCYHDLMVINVQNKMEGTAAALHWHGILQRNSQWMDGVPFVTQCPFGLGSFRYIFSADDYGTMFYHGHSGMQKVNGQYGPLIVRRPRCDEPWGDVYDYDLPDHYILISDWMHDYAEMFFPGLPTRPPGLSPATVLVNGIGRNKNANDPSPGVDKNTPLTTFHVEPYNRYRFRIIISGSMVCPFQIQIEDHDMTIIAADSYDVEPRTVNTLIGYTGERFDVVIDTGRPHWGKKSFWIYVRAVGICESNTNLDQYAVLSYGTNKNDIGIFPFGVPPSIYNPLPVYTRINHANAVCGASPIDLCIRELHHIGNNEDYQILNAIPDVRVKLELGFSRFNIDYLHRKGNYKTFMNVRQDVAQVATINGISSMTPMSMMLLNRNSDAEYCNSLNSPTSHHDLGPGNETDAPYRECTHVIRVKKNAIVEIDLRDAHGSPSGLNHPIHMHGNPFYVMKMTQGGNMTQDHTPTDNYHFSYKQPQDPVTEILWGQRRILIPLKDTVGIPGGGSVIMRWKAKNSGDWMFHCHLDWHMAVGMMMFFRVEGYIPPPPPGFPRCENFDPLMSGHMHR